VRSTADATIDLEGFAWYPGEWYEVCEPGGNPGWIPGPSLPPTCRLFPNKIVWRNNTTGSTGDAEWPSGEIQSAGTRPWIAQNVPLALGSNSITIQEYSERPQSVSVEVIRNAP